MKSKHFWGALIFLYAGGVAYMVSTEYRYSKSQIMVAVIFPPFPVYEVVRVGMSRVLGLDAWKMEEACLLYERDKGTSIVAARDKCLRSWGAF